MKNFTFAAILIAVFALASLAQTSKDDALVKATVRKLIDAQIAYDVKVLDSLLTADYIEISPLGEFDPRDKMLGFYAPEQRPKVDMKVSVEDTEYSIRVRDKHAIVIARLNYAVTVDGKPAPPRSLRATYLMEKQKSGWKIASAQYTGVRPQQPKQ